MKVYVYEATSADVPPAHRFTARIWCEVIGKKNKPTMDWHPVLFHGADGVELQARRIGVVAMVGGKDKTKIRNATPEPFRDVLLSIARSVNAARAAA